MSDVLTAAIERLWRRILLVVGFGRINRVDDSGVIQKMQVQFAPLETHDPALRLSEYGFASNPPQDSDCVAVFAGGDRSSGVVVATGHKASRLTGLESGEVGIYDDQGMSVIVRRDGIVVTGQGKNITVNGVPVFKSDGAFDAGADGYKVDGVKVVGAQMPVILPPAGGGVIDAQARATLAQLILTLKTHGLTL